ncbi:MAG: hypothetical protein HYX67_05340 [Candidatus Melainabacteria bacterium]|nr:hypothetical protein [Candidatus Melainabacteria bacterium]
MRAFKIKIRTGLPASKSLARALAIALGFLLSAFCFLGSAVGAQEDSTPVSISAATVPGETESSSPYVSLARQFQPDLSKEDLRRRPLLYFRMWANKPLPMVPSFLFLLFITVVASELMPAFTTAARALFASEIGVPLAVLSLAVLEFFLLVGTTISVTLIGQTILSVLSPKRAPSAKRHWVKRLAAPLVGSLLLSLLLIIPPLGILPRVGIRLIMLLSFLGMGAWFRTGMGTKEMGGSSEL